MRVANEVSAPELDLVISQFVEDFQGIIRRQVEHALKKALGRGYARASGEPRARTEKPRGQGRRPAPKKAHESARAATQRARLEQPVSAPAAAAKRKASAKQAAADTPSRARAASKRGARKRTEPNPGQLSLF